MSTFGADGAQVPPPVDAAWQRLAEVVHAASVRLEDLEGALRDCRSRVAELEEHLERFLQGQETPSELLGRLRRLEEENRDLRERIAEARTGVERMLARVRFLQENA